MIFAEKTKKVEDILRTEGYDPISISVKEDKKLGVVYFHAQFREA